MIERIVIAGFGGQGVLSLGQFIAYSAMYEGKEVSWLPSYGPEMRGGTANCSVVVSDKPIASPIIAAPDTLIAMNKPSLDKFVNAVRPGGLIIVNSSLIDTKVERTDVRTLYVDASALAAEAGNAKTANIIVFGAYVSHAGSLEKENAIATVSKIFAKKPKVIPANLKAFDIGYNLKI